MSSYCLLTLSLASVLTIPKHIRVRLKLIQPSLVVLCFLFQSGSIFLNAWDFLVVNLVIIYTWLEVTFSWVTFHRKTHSHAEDGKRSSTVTTEYFWWFCWLSSILNVLPACFLWGLLPPSVAAGLFWRHHPQPWSIALSCWHTLYSSCPFVQTVPFCVVCRLLFDWLWPHEQTTRYVAEPPLLEIVAVHGENLAGDTQRGLYTGR